MTKEQFFKENDERFLSLGFVKDEQDPMFYYVKVLVSDEEIEENGLDQEDVPQLLYGSTIINKGFCIYTGQHFIWLNFDNPKDAIEFSEKIVAFEEC